MKASLQKSRLRPAEPTTSAVNNGVHFASLWLFYNTKSNVEKRGTFKRRALPLTFEVRVILYRFCGQFQSNTNFGFGTGKPMSGGVFKN